MSQHPVTSNATLESNRLMSVEDVDMLNNANTLQYTNKI